MSIRKLVSAAGIAAVGSTLAILAPTVATQAAPSGGCPYPPNRPVLTFFVSPATVVAHHRVVTFGKMSQNNCGIKNASIAVQHRALVNGKPSGKWVTFKTRATNSNGVFSATRYPSKNEQLRGVFTKAAGLPTTTSKAASVLVRTFVSFKDTVLSKCQIQMSGSTSPVKANRSIVIQGRDPKGSFNGWTKLASTKTNAKGAYNFTKTALCGKTYNLRALVGADKVNGYGASRTIFGIKTHK